jgi:hypothetical protein
VDGLKRYNKKRQEGRRIQQIKRYRNKLLRYDNLSKESLAYAAGLIDGEGCILIIRGKPRGVRVTPQYSLRIVVGMSVLTGVKFLHELFGGSISVRANREYKPVNVWSVQTIQAEGVLRNILPYLRVKKEEARIGLEFREHMNSYIRANGRIINKDEVSVREEYKNKMEFLKHG